jgi:hypothetical protein
MKMWTCFKKFNKNDILQNKALATLFCSSNKLYPINCSSHLDET